MHGSVMAINHSTDRAAVVTGRGLTVVELLGGAGVDVGDELYWEEADLGEVLAINETRGGWTRVFVQSLTVRPGRLLDELMYRAGQQMVAGVR